MLAEIGWLTVRLEKTRTKTFKRSVFSVSVFGFSVLFLSCWCPRRDRRLRLEGADALFDDQLVDGDVHGLA
jgi:hypothetical protein